jgi:hypothetical protein
MHPQDGFSEVKPRRRNRRPRGCRGGRKNRKNKQLARANNSAPLTTTQRQNFQTGIHPVVPLAKNTYDDDSLWGNHKQQGPSLTYLLRSEQKQQALPLTILRREQYNDGTKQEQKLPSYRTTKQLPKSLPQQLLPPLHGVSDGLASFPDLLRLSLTDSSDDEPPPPPPPPTRGVKSIPFALPPLGPLLPGKQGLRLEPVGNYRGERHERQRQGVGNNGGGSLFVTSPRSFLHGADEGHKRKEFW